VSYEPGGLRCNNVADWSLAISASSLMQNLGLSDNMAARAFWKGYLKLSLVTCPVAMPPATSENEKVRSTPSIARLGIAYVVTMSMLKPVNPSTKMKRSRGKRGPNQFVPLENQEIEAVALESTRTIDIDM